MSDLGLSRQELFLALPRLARIDPEAAENILAALRREVVGQPYQELKQLRDEASFREQTGDQAEAIRLSEEVLRRCRAGRGTEPEIRWELASLATRRLASDDPDQAAFADADIAELASGPADMALATALLARAAARVRRAGVVAGGNPALTDIQREAALASWEDLEQAERCAVPPVQEASRLLARVGLCRVLGRDDEGLRASAVAIEHFRARLPRTELSPTRWGDWLEQLHALYGYRAELLMRQRPPQVCAAFEAADQGRAQAVRQQLAWAAGDAQAAANQPDTPAYPDLLALLRRESAALAMLDVGARESFVFVADPAKDEPVRVPLTLTTSELASLLPAKQEHALAKRKLFKALPVLSEALAPALAGVAGRCKVLYLSPSSELVTVPFAALTLDGGGFVAEHCATAYAPSTAILRWCIGRRRTLDKRQFLAFGAGGTQDEQGAPISFAAQAQAIADRVAAIPGMSSRLLPEGTTPPELLDAASTAALIHLECHGYLDSSVSAVLSSFLEFSREPTLHNDAQQVAERRGQLQAELVFLDACLSGTFSPTMRNEVGGFWQAFLVAGVASLIATLTPVDPRRASELVTGFYDHRLGSGLGHAQALRAAQLAMLAAGRGPEDWATHIVIGDGG